MVMNKILKGLYSDIIIHNSPRFSLNISQVSAKIDHNVINVPYWCTNLKEINL